jgi:hypothetical protein
LFAALRRPGRIYISGTGRAGTTFLMQLFTELGLDTGFKQVSDKRSYFPSARAGLEQDLFNPKGPGIVKSPFLCDHVDDVLAAGFKIGHVIIPVRNFEQAAASRRHVQAETTGSPDGEAVVGGLWGTSRANEQAGVISRKFCKLVEALVRNDIPMTFLSFPRLALDADYLFGKVSFAMPGVSQSVFLVAFRKISRPDLIHDFHASEGGGSPVDNDGDVVETELRRLRD